MFDWSKCTISETEKQKMEMNKNKITLSFFTLFVLSYVTGTSASNVTGNGYIDLTQDTMNGPGVGFAFQDSQSMQIAKELVSVELAACSIGPLDAVYFYLFNCTVPSEFIVSMASIVGSGFLFTSDKSLTIETDVSSTSLLLANAWNMSLHYSSQSNCQDEFEVISQSKGCVAGNGCNNSLSVEVGCGSLSCTGCVLDQFFTDYVFEEASFELMD